MQISNWLWLKYLNIFKWNWNVLRWAALLPSSQLAVIAFMRKCIRCMFEQIGTSDTWTWLIQQTFITLPYTSDSPFSVKVTQFYPNDLRNTMNVRINMAAHFTVSCNHVFMTSSLWSFTVIKQCTNTTYLWSGLWSLHTLCLLNFKQNPRATHHWGEDRGTWLTDTYDRYTCSAASSHYANMYCWIWYELI